MKKFLKIFGISLLVFIGILIAIPFIFKGKILQTVKKTINEQINAKVEFKDVSLSVFRGFPDLRLGLEKLTVTGVDSFKLDTLVAFDKFNVDINLFSLFGDEIKVNAIVLDNPTIHGIVLKSGKSNWDIAKPSTDTTAKKTTDTTTTKFKLNLKRFAINHANITYDDQKGSMYAEIKDLNYKLKGDLTQDFTSLSNKLEIKALSFSMSGLKYMKNAKIDLDMYVDADLKNMKFTLKENVLKLNALEFGLDGTVAMPKEDIDMDIRFEAKKAEFKHFLSLIPAIYMKDYSDLKASGKLGIKAYAKGTYNAKNLPAFGAEVVIENGNFKYPALPKSVDNVNINIKAVNYGGTGNNMDIDISKFHVEIAKNPFDVTMHVKKTVEDVNLKGKFDGTLDLNSIKDVIPLDSTQLQGTVVSNIVIDGNLSSIEKEKYEEFKADGRLELKNIFYQSPDLKQGALIKETVLLFSPKYVDLQSFDCKVGKSDIQMNGKLQNFLAFVFTDRGIMKGNLNVTSTLLDANEFLSGSTTTTTTTTAKDTAALTAFAVPANIDFTLTSKFTKVLYDKLSIDNVNGVIVLKESKVAMQDLKLNTLNGVIGVNGSYDAKNIKQPKIDFGLDVANIDIPAAFNAFNTIQQLAPIAKYCKGLISAKFTLKSDLDYHLNPQLKTISSVGRFQSKTIQITDSKLFMKIGELLKSDKYKKPTLQDVNVGYKIIDGKITIDPFDTKIADNKANISGTQGIDKSMDYKINFTIPKAQFGTTANNVMNDLISKAKTKGINVENKPDLNVVAFVTGTTDNPQVKLSLTEDGKAAVESVKEQVKEVVQENAQKYIQEADQKAQKILKDAQNEADKIKKAAKEAGDKLQSEADANGKKLVEQAGSNFIAKKAAEKTAEEGRKKAKKEADKLNQEAENKSNAILEKARKEAAKAKTDAEQKSKLK